MKETITTINEAIIAELKRADVRTYGLAESIAVRGDEDVTFPALVLPDGECISVYSETDKHDVTLYHRLQDISFQEDTTSFGSSKSYTKVADMSLLVFGKREVVSQYYVEQVARKAIALRNECTLVRSDFNALQIFASEYMGVTYFLGSAYFLFKINYRITSTFNRCTNIE